ncbi:MAG TPA: AAA family ATPase [Gammaproteobacteria bacterium]|nr:AAA family ATPase [Gammaproteobacteria bacterium]
MIGQPILSNTGSPFKDHPQIPQLIDILSRQDYQPVLLVGPASQKIQIAILEGIAEYLATFPAPKILQHADFIYLFDENLNSIESNIQMWCEQLHANNKHAILVINRIEPLLNEETWFKSIVANQQCRVIVLTQPFRYQKMMAQQTYLGDKLISIWWQEPSEIELPILLKHFKTSLEQFHHVNVAEEVFSSAISMANHYLPGRSCLEKALTLLDSAAARTNAAQLLGSPTSTVTSVQLAAVVSSWTQIPLSHLQNNTFQATKFIEAMQRNIFGQETAIRTVSVLLQNAYIKLQKKSGPLCNLLLAGPSGAGKTEFTHTMAEQLFGHTNALLHVHFDKTTTLLNSKVAIGKHEKRCVNFLTAIQETPYAIILLENIELLTADALNIVKEILMQGYTIDTEGNQYDFRHAVIVMTTKAGAEQIDRLSKKNPSSEIGKPADLMQLVLNTHTQDTLSSQQYLSPQEMCDQWMPLISAQFSSELLSHVNLIPFVPLDYSAFEKIMRLKLKLLAKHLSIQFNVELDYAPEIIKFLAHEAVWHCANNKSLSSLLDEHLYSCVSHAILTRRSDKNKFRRVSLQLNDNGQLLRCEFIASSEMPLYTI